MSVSERPIFSVLPRNQFASLSQPFVSFDCVVQGNPRPHLAWLFNSEKILLNDRVSLKHNGTIFIENIQTNDAGQYTCQAENINGVIAASAYLDVMRKSTISLYIIVVLNENSRLYSKPIFNLLNI